MCMYRIDIAVKRAKNSPKDRAGKKSLSQSTRFTGTCLLFSECKFHLKYDDSKNFLILHTKLRSNGLEFIEV